MQSKRRRLKYLILHDTKYTFAFGVLLGIGFAGIFHVIQNNPPFLSSIWPAIIQNEDSEQLNYDNAPYNFTYEKWLLRTYSGLSCALDPDVLRYSNGSKFYSTKCGHMLSSGANLSWFKRDIDHADPRSEAYFLSSNVDIACLILSKDVIKSTAVRDTWGRHCNSLDFISSKKLEVDQKIKQQNSSILTKNPVSVDQLTSGSEFALLCKGLRQLWIRREDEIQWVFVTLEDTFALPENLRYYVATMDPQNHHYLGHAMKFWNIIYNWADAGYVISKGTLQKFLEKFPNDETCEKGGKYWKNSDWYLGKHLNTMDIHPVDTRDHIGRSRFIGHSLKKLLFPGGVSLFERYWRDSLYLSPDGPHCCSNFAITFHLTTSITRIFQFYYLYYHLRPFSGGGTFGNQMAPQPKRSLKSPPLTLDEQLKEQALDKIFLNKILKKT